MAKVAYLFFITGCIVAVLIVLIFHAAQLTQPQQDILSATLGALAMALQSAIHSVFNTSEHPTQLGPTAQENKL